MKKALIILALLAVATPALADTNVDTPALISAVKSEVSIVNTLGIAGNIDTANLSANTLADQYVLLEEIVLLMQQINAETN